MPETGTVLERDLDELEMANEAMRTGYSHPKCFARELRDCSHQISKEHFISRGLLEMIRGNQPLRLTGPAWIESTGEKEVSIASLASKMLCRKHNEELAPLDQEMISFARALLGTSASSGTLRIRGELVEKWFVKAHEGYLASGTAHKALKGWAASQRVLGLLFGNAQFAPRCGFYYLMIQRPHTAGSNEFGLFPVAGSAPSSIAGLAFFISGFPFLYLPIPPWPELLSRTLGSELIYRPEVIKVQDQSGSRTILTGWKTGDVVEVRITQPPPK